MLNPDAHLNPNLFDEDVEKQPTRNGYGTGLVKAGEKNENVVALCADLTESTRTKAFADKFPKRYFQIGVAEQAMATVAAGLAVSGKVAFIASYATFSPGRNWEQIRTTAAYNYTNVKIAGHHAGISVGPDGATHQAIEDIATMRSIPRMQVMVPVDAVEGEKATMAAAHIFGPVYLRWGRENTPIMTTEKTPFTPGKATVFWESENPQVVIIGSGSLLYKGLLAAKALQEEGIGSVVMNLHTIKPIDREAIVTYAEKCGAVVTIEEHNIMGGVGSAVAEVLAQNLPTPQEFIGMQDTFGESGPPDELIAKYGLDEKAVITAAKKVIGRKLG